MFIAAIVDAWPELAPGLKSAMRAAGLPRGWSIQITPHSDGTLAGSRLAVTAKGRARSRPTGSFAEIRERLSASRLESVVRTRAIDIFTLLAEAEGQVHGLSPDDVHFHEIADWDSIADIVGAAWLIEILTSRNRRLSWSVAPLPLGAGRIDTEHGPMPVPAPATAKLIEGFLVVDDGIAGERITPTGAAILRHLAPAERPGGGGLEVAQSGHGFGSRTLPGISNVLRLLAFDDGARWQDEQIAVIAFEVDDQTAEDLAVGLEAIRGEDGVLDATQMPAYGKKGRIAASVQVLCRRQTLDAVIARCFAETTTIGLRWSLAQRAVLPRRSSRAQDGKGEVRVKVVTRPDGATAKAEIDDLSGESAGRRSRKRRRRTAEAAALKPTRRGSRRQ